MRQSKTMVHIVSSRVLVIEKATTVFEILIYIRRKTTEQTMMAHISIWSSDRRVDDETGTINKEEIKQRCAGVSSACGLRNFDEVHSIQPVSSFDLTTRAKQFLALLDYVSGDHEIKIRPSSVVRPSVASIISEVIAWISFKF